MTQDAYGLIVAPNEAGLACARAQDRMMDKTKTSAERGGYEDLAGCRLPLLVAMRRGTSIGYAVLFIVDTDGAVVGDPTTVIDVHVAA